MDTSSPPKNVGTSGLSSEPRRTRHLRWFEELADAGTDLAREAGRQALADKAAKVVPMSLVFANASRVVRQAIMLDVQIANGSLVPGRPVRRADKSRTGVQTAVQRTVNADWDDDDEDEDIDDAERLDREDLAHKIRAGASVEAVVGIICSDLRIAINGCQQTDQVRAVAERLRRVRDEAAAWSDPLATGQGLDMLDI